MERKQAVTLSADRIRSLRRGFRQALNPRSYFRGTGLGSQAGLQRIGVTVAWLPPG